MPRLNPSNSVTSDPVPTSRPPRSVANASPCMRPNPAAIHTSPPRTTDGMDGMDGMDGGHEDRWAASRGRRAACRAARAGSTWLFVSPSHRRVRHRARSPRTGAPVRRRHRCPVPWRPGSPPGSRAARLGVAFKFIQAAQDRWQVVNAPHLVALVRADAVRQRQARRTTRRTPPMGSRLKVLHPQASDAPEAVDVVHGPYCRPGAFSSGCLEEVFDSLGGFVHRDGSDTARRRSEPR